MRQFIFLIPFFWIACQPAPQQSADSSAKMPPVLFTAGDSTIFADEFIYVYEKNNAQMDSAFTRNDISEYLDLYENFKVKIMEAYARGYDTLNEYRTELSSYEEQLKQPYLTETRVTDELINEAFDRSREEIRASHILIRFPEKPTPEDTVRAKERITDIREMAVNGASFDSLAAEFSEDPSARTNRGDLGYFTSMQMVYPFENAAYNTPVGSISPVIRTRFGYHIIKVNDRRGAHGPVIVSHLMLRHQPDTAAVRNRIFELHEQAAGGVPWEQLVKEHSEDLSTRERGGVLNPFSVGQAPIPFQEAAFSLQSKGDISDPVQTQFGWHILRLVERRPLPTREALEPAIQQRIAQDERSVIGQEFLISRLKEEWGFSENPEAKSMVREMADSTLNSGQWALPPVNDNVFLFSIGDQSYTQYDFALYLADNQKPNAQNPESYILQKYTEFKQDAIIRCEESHLEEKYPEYKMLLREYREGILYFKLMEEEIWKRASEDSAGQRAYYQEHKDQYPGTTTAVATVYALPDSVQCERLISLLKEGASLDSFLSEFQQLNSSPLLPVEVEWSMGDDSPWKSVPMQVGIYQKNIMYKWYVIHVTDVQENKVKPFEKIRGLVISDYQQFLEERWVQQLRDKYPVIRNESGVNYVYEALVR
ncbi:peptidylprolyl isomerase [Fulvivirga sedimenti]|uniref:Peptidylprolyl isomerase n=1 Tax=Fulvivirga sedimenti TaxID=2879465 RepID=A0A9X1HXI3_9BACT|nr:peptidylprolyl isomerase [Fulvivirga sedimenti]MCA6078277.1 peptidylprolyl isomerase [Fulvivirga sedimenti]